MSCLDCCCAVSSLCLRFLSCSRFVAVIKKPLLLLWETFVLISYFFLRAFCRTSFASRFELLGLRYRIGLGRKPRRPPNNVNRSKRVSCPLIGRENNRCPPRPNSIFGSRLPRAQSRFCEDAAMRRNQSQQGSSSREPHFVPSIRGSTLKRG